LLFVEGIYTGSAAKKGRKASNRKGRKRRAIKIKKSLGGIKRTTRGK